MRVICLLSSFLNFYLPSYSFSVLFCSPLEISRKSCSGCGKERRWAPVSSEAGGNSAIVFHEDRFLHGTFLPCLISFSNHYSLILLSGCVKWCITQGELSKWLVYLPSPFPGCRVCSPMDSQINRPGKRQYPLPFRFLSVQWAAWSYRGI